MSTVRSLRIGLTVVCLSFVAVTQAADVHAEPASAAAPSAAQVLAKANDTDPWGMGGVEATSRAVITDKGKVRELAFESKSRRTTGSLSKSLIRFKSPADVSGMKFLQIQKADEDDDRHLYVPELKRSRRIAAGTRSEGFMGTVYSYGDVDRRDVRSAKAVSKPDETIGKYDCVHIEATPTNADALYGKIEIWARKDNMIPVKQVFYAKGSSSPTKTLMTKEIQKLKDRWHITRSTMTEHASGKTTEIIFEKVEPRDDISAELFSVRNLEKE